MQEPLPSLTPSQREALIEATRSLEALAFRQRYNRAAYYRPYPKQRLFHDIGATKRERAFLAANQSGKTFSAAMEVGFHLTGRYPDDWSGRRFDGPTSWWAASDTGETTRDNPQRLLLGRLDDYGSGAIPIDAIDLESVRPRTGVPEAVSIVRVRHVSGGLSSLAFKSYDQGRQKFQGETLHGVWLDEESPADIYAEARVRTNVLSGLVMLTATPLLGMTEVVGQFYPTPNTEDRALVQMTIDEVEHYTPEQRASIIAGYSAHELEARARGIPMLGSGRVFPIPESTITCEPFAIPKHWPQITGIDFGWDHPFAAAHHAWDREADTVYVTRTYRESKATPPIHAAAIKPWGEWVPVAWPQDGLQSGKDTGEALMLSYRKHGLSMLPEHAKDPTDGVSVEAGVLEMLERMQTGRLKVFNHLGDWLEEFRQYHRDKGKIVAIKDDLISATRYALMCLRFARTKGPDIPQWMKKRQQTSGSSAWAS